MDNDYVLIEQECRWLKSWLFNTHNINWEDPDYLVQRQNKYLKYRTIVKGDNNEPLRINLKEEYAILLQSFAPAKDRTKEEAEEFNQKLAAINVRYPKYWFYLPSGLLVD